MRSARRRMQEIERLTPKERHEQQLPKYRQLIRTTEQVVQNTRTVLQQTQDTQDLELIFLRAEIAHYCQLGQRVIDQARRRVLEGEQVPIAEKIYSIFETHTDLIKRGKARQPVEFGHKNFLAESAHGFITQYRGARRQPFRRRPRSPSSFSATRRRSAEPRSSMAAIAAFITNTISKPANRPASGFPASPSEAARKLWSGKLTRRTRLRARTAFRAGIEGRISVLFRGRGMKRCRLEGRERFELLVGAAVLANNLLRIADLLIKKQQPRRPAA